jgi:hypothetical protein
MIQKRLAKIINFRVYTTKWYCFEPSEANKIQKSNPLVLNNFPETGCTLTCHFGKIPESIINLKYSIDAYGLKKKKEIFSQSKSKEFRLEEFIAELKSDPDYLPRYAWATSIVIEMIINPHELGMIDENGNIVTSEAFRFFRESYEKIIYSEVFDKILLVFVTEMDPILFDELLISEMALLIDDKIIVAFPKTMETQAEGYQYCNGKAFNKERLLSLMQKVHTSDNNWLSNIAHWRISMLIEKDPWKKFYLGFICLEMLTHRAFKKIITQNKFDVMMKTGQHFDKSVKMPFADFIPKENECRKLPLLMKFSLVAGVLNPKKYETDVTDFKICKDFRDKMSHEGIYEKDIPPLEKLDNILNYYLRVALENI